MWMIKESVSNLIKKHKTNNPFQIVAEKNILVFFQPLGEILGYFHTYKRINMIHINSNLDEMWQRFVCAHELGHSVLHKSVNTPFLRRNTLFSVERIEREANTFAVELLLPDSLMNECEGTSIYDMAVTCGIPEEFARYKSYL
jgi:Zn-dependent peptidase ImmA (M78 family)